MTNIIIWNENIHEKENKEVKKIYPNGIHNCIKNFLSKDSSFKIETATLDQENNGLNKENLCIYPPAINSFPKGPESFDG